MLTFQLKFRVHVAEKRDIDYHKMISNTIATALCK